MAVRQRRYGIWRHGWLICAGLAVNGHLVLRAGGRLSSGWVDSDHIALIVAASVREVSTHNTS